MGSDKQNHTHVHRVRKVGPVWRCLTATGDCSFFVYFKQEHVLIGRACICWECGSEFKFSEDNLEQDMPTCFECRNPVTKTFDIDDFIAQQNK